MARRAVPARVQRAERMIEEVRLTLYVAPLNAARTAQCAIPTFLPYLPTQPAFVERLAR